VTANNGGLQNVSSTRSPLSWLILQRRAALRDADEAWDDGLAWADGIPVGDDLLLSFQPETTNIKTDVTRGL
jgi:hypothetical protein